MKCKSCGTEIIFLKTSAGKSIPVNAESVREFDELFNGNIHITHFATCPDANKFRKSKELK